MTDAENPSNKESEAGGLGSTSTTLLEQARAGDAQAWQRLVFLYTPLVRWWCRRFGVSRADDVDDVAQEVFATVAGKLAGFTKGATGGFRSWLFTISRNKAGDHYRRSCDKPVAVGGSSAHERLESIADADAHGSSDAAVSEQTILVRRALELVRPEFQPRTWEAAWRATVEGQYPADVAAALGMSVGAVHTAKSRVLSRLRDMLRDLLEDEPDQAAGPAPSDSGS